MSTEGTKVLNMPDVRKLIALIPFSDGVVACDSMLHHASAALNTPVPTIVLWGATSQKNLGYVEHTNMVSRPDVMIEPNRVPHDHTLYVNKNKGVNEFDLKWLDEIEEVLNNGNKTTKDKKK